MTFVKICGITSWEDADMAASAGADLLGFVCSANSERLIDPDTFAYIAHRLPSNVLRVGVFDGDVADCWRDAPQSVFAHFQRIQYYDNDLWSEIIKDNWDMRRKIRAFHLTRASDLRLIAGCNGLAQSYLINVNVSAPEGHEDPQNYGWELAKEVRQYGRYVFLAGGLTPANVQGAIARVHPYAVDVTVGVESAPGIKDRSLTRAFVSAVRHAE